ncbi:hypothetical protein IC614_09030 [Allosphingosinicella flava]|uniref:Uncharacterized protein n=1 Tax=Allosphingosinicella flava TaxID=2771430 RepID=A0A7T2GIH2_9SPHN|nr:hypothetical protein [Sphingosinicella flava]QPQ54478.1 hypothetical protein IC614_09030 [Sphingosinicella flava]
MTRYPAAALLLALAACSSEQPMNEETGPAATNSAVPPSAAREPKAPVPPAALAPANLLTLEGLGPLRIGQPVPANSGWAERGAQASDTCRIVTSPSYPGIYAIVEDGRVRRITVGEGERATVTLAEGIGVGATEAEVRAAFPGFREEPHHYVEAPAKYLTAPNAESGDPALRFETGADGKVSLIHVGTMPVLGYVEGCA